MLAWELPLMRGDFAQVRCGLAHGRTGFGVHPRGGDLAGFHELLEAPQIAARLDLRLALEEFRDQLADAARGRIVGNCRGHPRAAPAGASRKSIRPLFVMSAPASDC